MIRHYKVAYFMASVDDLETNKKFAAQEDADFPMLSDPGKDVARAYGVVTDQRPLAARWTFYIGPDGKILYIDRKVSAGTAGEDLAAHLKELGVPQRQ